MSDARRYPDTRWIEKMLLRRGKIGGDTIENMSPVGTYYFTAEPTNPASILGYGTWEQVGTITLD